MKNLVESSATKMAGDGKTPNKYWVTISSDYMYYNPKSEAMDWISDLKLFEVKGKTVDRFDTFKQAMEFCDNSLYLGMDYDDIRVNSMFIEDRISGEVYNRMYEFFPASGEVSEVSYQSTEFTEEKLKELGKVFA